ncbi:MAG: UDP-N-acetylmuramate--L-alanine ligase [Clostridiales bacterium GWF2_38_85]|nr:MAG: UDP-N-acetylmuramate--L-alanine ligase [Clostridiales bacterium GWF2_38_85]HBL84966.1 UDP-N-acetylmuramate--L-alanine ligase [Clostridiales bacterium]
MKSLNEYKSIYFIGIGGISMSSLAMILKNRGYNIAGYDRRKTTATEKLENDGITIFYDFNESNCAGADLCVYTAAIAADNPEIVSARNKNIPLITRGELLGTIAKDYRYSIGISGTHGKSTTSGMLSQIFLTHPEYDPTILVGAELPSIHSAFKTGRSESFIFEACEYKDSFLNFFPKICVVLNVELDHTDYFKSIENMTESFSKFITNCGEDGIAVINASSPNALKAVKGYKGSVISFSSEPDADADFTCNNVEFTEGFASFDVLMHHGFLMRVKLSVPGSHNISNALAAIACAKLCSLPNDAIIEGLSQFYGVCRRFEYKGLCNEAAVYDDYAHHPQEITPTLAAAKNMNPKSIIAIFEPHTYTRLHDFLNEFAEALSAADKVIIAPIYSAREQNIYGITQYDLSEKINGSIAFDSFEAINEYIRQIAKKGDIILTLGAGDVTELANMLVI